MRTQKEKKHKWWYGVWEFYHWDKDGNLIWSDTVENALADEGEELALAVFLKGQSQGSFYLGLSDDTPDDTYLLTDLSGEPSGNGYARQEIERSAVGWPTLAMDAGDFMATSKLVTVTASGGTIGPVTIMFLTDVVSGTAGKFIAWATLSATRTLQNGEALGCKMKIKAK
jgi:hypothetical protein